MNLQDLIKLTNSEEVGKLIYKMYLLEKEKLLVNIERYYWDDNGKSFIKYIEELEEDIEIKLKELK
jgi:hypothetical protein